MSVKELKLEEQEVLLSIYDGDENFKQISDEVFQYKVTSPLEKSFLLEIKWSENYPSTLPNINLDAFYNNKISTKVKCSIVEKIKLEAEQYLEMSMTYSLFEWAKENSEELLKDHDEAVSTNEISQSLEETSISKSNQEPSKKPKERKEQLTKAQKRKIINRLDQSGQNPRGYNWVDVIKHLSQIGSKDQRTEEFTN